MDQTVLLWGSSLRRTLVLPVILFAKKINQQAHAFYYLSKY